MASTDDSLGSLQQQDPSPTNSVIGGLLSPPLLKG
ncbi:rCG23557 [Rattus norvegicus]|uniref:RCG23557 n=1 Tax=Rattus norvegicus TaxID=10116 RepID=A6KH66_RAT|nr:rCG23557 [Rattus norvegicus]